MEYFISIHCVKYMCLSLPLALLLLGLAEGGAPQTYCDFLTPILEVLLHGRNQLVSYFSNPRRAGRGFGDPALCLG